MAEISEFSPTKIRNIVARRGGFSTSEKFEIGFTASRGASASQDIATLMGEDHDLRYLCENVALPTKSIMGVDKMIYGLNYQMPYRHTFPEVAMTFYCTKNMREKKIFDKWQEMIVNPNTGDLSFYEDYTCDITVKKFHKDAIDFSSPVYAFKLYKPYFFTFSFNF